jgi:hypothetical protein
MMMMATTTNVVKMTDPLYLEAEALPKSLYAFLYFNNGKRLQIVGEKGEIATLNLSKTDDYGHLFCLLISALWRKHGRLLIRGEHLTHLPAYLHPYFEPMDGGDGK